MELLNAAHYEDRPRFFYDPMSRRVIVGFVHLTEKYLGYDPIARIWFNVDKMDEVKFGENFDIIAPPEKSNTDE